MASILLIVSLSPHYERDRPKSTPADPAFSDRDLPTPVSAARSNASSGLGHPPPQVGEHEVAVAAVERRERVPVPSPRRLEQRVVVGHLQGILRDVAIV